MSGHLTPIEVVECLVAPISDLGGIVGCHPKSPYGWRGFSKHRAEGDIPHHAMRRLHAHATARNIPLTADHLIWGAPRRHIEALMAGMGKPMPEHLRGARRPASDTSGGVAAE